MAWGLMLLVFIGDAGFLEKRNGDKVVLIS